MSVAFQTSRGPGFGQDLSSPVSVDTLSRFGPRNCGQSAAPPGADSATAMTSARQVERVFIGSGSLIRKTNVRAPLAANPFVYLTFILSGMKEGGTGELAECGHDERAC